MGWRFTDDVEAYAEWAWDLLARDPVRNTIALTVIEAIRAGQRWSDRELTFGWHDDGEVRGAVSLTPPYELLLAVVPGDTVDELVAALRSARVEVPGVNGAAADVDRFTAAWMRGTPLRVEVALELRLYRLAGLRRPEPEPPGRARPATPADIATVVPWLQAFEAEAGVSGGDVEPALRTGIADGRVWLWEDGEPVALAARTPPAVGVVRVNRVYTPPGRRRRGYGAATTAACIADALARGARDVVLFTDLANPTSNSVYQRIGFRPVGDYRVVRFRG